MSFDDLRAIILNATICVWAVAGLLMAILFQLFSARPLRLAPTRRSLLSLPVVGLIAIVYIAASIFASVIANGFTSIAGVATTAPATAPATFPTTLPSPFPTTAEGPESLLLSQFISISAQLAALLPFFLAVPALFPERFRGLGLHPAQLKKGLLFGFMAFLTCFGILQIAGFATQVVIEYFRQGRPIDVHPTFIALRQSPPVIERIGFFLMAGILAPFAEEVFFRGLFQTTLIQRGWGFIIPQLSPNLLASFKADFDAQKRRDHQAAMGEYIPSTDPLPYASIATTTPTHPSPLHRLAAIVIVSVIFARLHQADHFAVLFLLSFALGYIYERTGTLWAPIVLHALFNSVMLIPTLVNPAVASLR